MRLDLSLLHRKLASTRSKAQELIRMGYVLVDGLVVTKTGFTVSDESKVEVVVQEHPFVSRGGVKLEAALENWSISVQGARVLDIGQSTGGFTECLLARGASSVVGVEVGHGQLADKLRKDTRVEVFEKLDIRNLPETFERFSIVVADLSFISLLPVLPKIKQILVPGGQAVVLVKPQFELTSREIGSGGIVRENKFREQAIKNVVDASEELGFTVAGEMKSTITGGDGNQEYLLWLKVLS